VLEDDLLDASHDTQAWLVYADELAQAGDPRGELAVVQHQLVHARTDEQLRARERELKARCLPGLDIDALDPALKWYCGHVIAIWLGERSLPGPGRVATLTTLLNAPCSRFVQEIILDNRAPKYGELLARSLPALRSLSLGGPVTSRERTDDVYLRLDAPRLEHLSIGWPAHIGPFLVPKLRTLEAPSLGPKQTLTVIDRLQRERWPLEKLVLSISHDAAAHAIQPSLERLLVGTPLYHLGLLGAVDYLSLLGSALLRQLRVLQIDQIDEALAEWFVASRDELAHLTRIECRHVNPAARESLLQLPVRIVSEYGP